MTINGRAVLGYRRRTISYADVALIAGQVEPTVTYLFRGTGANGSLLPGDRVAVAPDLVLNAFATVSA